MLVILLSFRMGNVMVCAMSVLGEHLNGFIQVQADYYVLFEQAFHTFTSY